jgi:hypothetical protein
MAIRQSFNHVPAIFWPTELKSQFQITQLLYFKSVTSVTLGHKCMLKLDIISANHKSTFCCPPFLAGNSSLGVNTPSSSGKVNYVNGQTDRIFVPFTNMKFSIPILRHKFEYKPFASFTHFIFPATSLNINPLHPSLTSPRRLDLRKRLVWLPALWGSWGRRASSQCTMEYRPRFSGKESDSKNGKWTLKQKLWNQPPNRRARFTKYKIVLRSVSTHVSKSCL